MLLESKRLGRTQSFVSILPKVREASRGDCGIDYIANLSQPVLESVQPVASQKAVAFAVWHISNEAHDGLGTVPESLLTFLKFKTR